MDKNFQKKKWKFFIKKHPKYEKSGFPGSKRTLFSWMFFFFQEKKDGFPVKNDRYIRRYDIG